MIQLGDLCNDPDFCQPGGVTIIRTRGAFVAGGWQAAAPVNVASSGTIVPADAEALNQIPEADRVDGSLQFLTSQPIYETLEKLGAISDKLQWNGNLYRVQSVTPWKDFGFYSAILVRMSGA